MVASHTGHSEIINLLLNAGANPEQQSKDGWTALMIGRQSGRSEVVNILLKAGAKLKQEEKEGGTAFMIGTLKEH